MASTDELRKLGARYEKDGIFRALLEANPRIAAQSMGITLTRDQEEEIKRICSEDRCTRV
jgi:hypothetical protein